MKQSEEYLTAGNWQAVQEILWLLETVSTAFQGFPVGEGTIQGKYFNKIADELKLHRKGQVAEQAIGWMKTLHGYLSSPTGGGVRHGATLTAEGELCAPRSPADLQLDPKLLVFPVGRVQPDQNVDGHSSRRLRAQQSGFQVPPKTREEPGLGRFCGGTSRSSSVNIRLPISSTIANSDSI